MNFLRNHWFDLGGILALAVLLFLFFRWPILTDYQLLMWIGLVSLLAHQLEEYRVVGTFPGMFNRVMANSPVLDRYPLNTNTSFYVNVGIGWSVYWLAALRAEQAVWLGIAAILISVGNTVAHTVLFNLKGKTFYNAGMATSWFLFVPIIYSFFTLVSTHQLATVGDYAMGISLGILLNVVGILKMIDWLKDKNTVYIFPQRCLLPRDRHPYPSAQIKNERNMKSVLLIWGVLISLFAFSCQKTERSSEETTSKTAVTELKADEIVRDTVTNTDRVQLAMAFNNTNQTATFVLNGETIDLKQERMASGIKYTNADYEFTEHQGEMTLKKGGNVIFTYKR